MNVQIAEFGHLGDVSGRQQRRRIVLDQDRRPGDPVSGFETVAVIARRLDGLAVVERRRTAVEQRIRRCCGRWLFRSAPP